MDVLLKHDAPVPPNPTHHPFKPTNQTGQGQGKSIEQSDLIYGKPWSRRHAAAAAVVVVSSESLKPRQTDFFMLKIEEKYSMEDEEVIIPVEPEEL